MSRDQKGFTVIEVMVVLAIIGLLAAILIPTLLKARQRAGRNAQIKSSEEAAQIYPLKSGKTLTIGNNSFVPLNLKGDIQDAGVARIILLAEASFEKYNPDKKVLVWTVEKQPDSSATHPKIFGLWAHHEPVPVVLEKR